MPLSRTEALLLVAGGWHSGVVGILVLVVVDLECEIRAGRMMPTDRLVLSSLACSRQVTRDPALPCMLLRSI